MAHELTVKNGRASMTYTGATPWHGLGQKLTVGASIETWVAEAGLNWSLNETPALYLDPMTADLRGVPGRKVLVRDDNSEALSVVGESYKVVQPKEVVTFYRDLVREGGYDLDTAGALQGGRRYWALAKVNKTATIMRQDKIEGYLLLATACDGSLATTAMFTSVRVVCANTLGFAIRDSKKKGAQAVRVAHNTVFNPTAAKTALGLVDGSWDLFMQDVNRLASRKVTMDEAKDLLIESLGQPYDQEIMEMSFDDWKEAQGEKTIVKNILTLFNGRAIGYDMQSAKGTAWGLMNATTEFFDHHRLNRSQDTRLNKAWFGDGATSKQKVFDKLVAYAS